MNDADGRHVALKVLQQEHRGSKTYLDFLKHEYEVGRQLEHPNTIKIYDFSTAGGVPHLVLEMFASKNLKQAIRLGVDQLAPMAPSIGEQAALGLAHVHDKGWIHCDVKPENFLVNDEGEVKLIDFALAQRQRRGLAKLFGGRSKVQGTRSYMSPEQIRGEPLDPRADIYSFGCVLFELLSGKLPYAAASPNELLTKHLRSPVPSAAGVNNNITPDCAALISSMMAKRKQERPETMNEFVKAFQRLRVYRTRPQASGSGDPKGGGGA